MKKVNSKIFYYSRIILNTFLSLWCVFSLQAHGIKNPFYKEVYVIINHSSAQLQSVFTLIEQQTQYSFVYDENDINLSTEIKLTKGRQRLKIGFK